MKIFILSPWILFGGCFLFFYSAFGQESAGKSAKIQSIVNYEKKGGWRAFGYGIMDSAFSRSRKQFHLDVNWGPTSWGVGCMFTLKEPIGDRKLQAVRLKVRTLAGSKSKIFASVATNDDANLATPKSEAIELTKQWETITFPIAEMINDMPERKSRPFDRESDHGKIQIIKLLFTKPSATVPIKDKLFIREPELIFEK